jgi:hypothetical protein
MSKPTIAIVGASADRSKFGNKAVRAYAGRGYEVFPIHPSAKDIEGIPAFARLTDVPRTSLDRISLYVPPAVGLKLLDDLAAKPSGEVWLNPGSESPELIDQAKARGLNVIVACSIIDIGASPHD